MRKVIEPKRVRAIGIALILFAIAFNLPYAWLAPAAAAQTGNGESTPDCKECAEWNAPQKPFRIYGNTYYVGVGALSSILIASGRGDILIDGDLNESAPQIADHIRQLGFRIRDVKLILNSHAHYDHAGGISQMQRLSGAAVKASPWTAQVLQRGQSPNDDPQFGVLPPIAKVARVSVLQDGETVHLGQLALTAHFTPGHTPGGTTWTWQSCEGTRCLNMVYADSQTAVSAPDYRYTDHKALLQGFDKSQALLGSLPCDVLLTPHPGCSPLLSKMLKGERPASFADPDACRKFAEDARAEVQKRVVRETAAK